MTTVVLNAGLVFFKREFVIVRLQLLLFCSGETKCQEERRTAKFELLQRPGQDIYIPECKADGSFMETQCHNGTGYCWCVSSDGKPIPGSSVEGHNTDCLKIGQHPILH